MVVIPQLRDRVPQPWRDAACSPEPGRRGGSSAIKARTTRHPGYAISERKRKRIEECLGWLKDIALFRELRHRGLLKVGYIFTFAPRLTIWCASGICASYRRRPSESRVGVCHGCKQAPRQSTNPEQATHKALNTSTKKSVTLVKIKFSAAC